ncbi:MAG TPA: hypothetical protein VGE63_00750 [Candidatus Paceibacterota bacterium]
METLSKIFQSVYRVKLMRLFLFNPQTTYTIQALITTSRISRAQALKEIKILESAGFIKKAKDGKANVNTYSLEPKFPLIEPLKSLIIDSELIRTKDIAEKFTNVGVIKLLILSGIFTKNESRQVDIFVVGDKVDKQKFMKAMMVLESEIGKELRYCLFTPEEYAYRINMHDSLVLDVINYPNQRIIDKISPRS